MAVKPSLNPRNTNKPIYWESGIERRQRVARKIAEGGRLTPMPRQILATDVIVRDGQGKLVHIVIIPEKTRHLPPAGMK